MWRRRREGRVDKCLSPEHGPTRGEFGVVMGEEGTKRLWLQGMKDGTRVAFGYGLEGFGESGATTRT